MTAAELDDLIARDPVAALCYLVAESGCRMTLCGVPVTEAEFKSSARRSAEERLLRVTGLLP